MNEHIRDLLGKLLEREIAFRAGVLVTVVGVDTSKDLRYTRASVSVFPESASGYAMQTLSHEQRVLERSLHRELATRPLPRLEFILDTTERDAAVVERLLRTIRTEE